MNYSIQSGDTLSQIASRSGRTIAELMAINPQITNPDRIYAGQTLNIPSTETPINPATSTQTGAQIGTQTGTQTPTVDMNQFDSGDPLRKFNLSLLDMLKKAQSGQTQFSQEQAQLKREAYRSGQEVFTGDEALMTPEAKMATLGRNVEMFNPSIQAATTKIQQLKDITDLMKTTYGEDFSKMLPVSEEDAQTFKLALQAGMTLPADILEKYKKFFTADDFAQWAQANRKGKGGGEGGGDYTPSASGLSDSQIQILRNLGLEPTQFEVIAGIYSGIAPPLSPAATRSKFNQGINAGLAAIGYNTIIAHRDYTAMKNSIENMTSAKALELRRAVISLEGSTRQAERLYATWQATGLPSGFSSFNKIALNSAARLPGEAGVAARTLLSHIEDMAAELAIVYRGGGQATDDALAQAQKSLSADWNEAQFGENLALIRENLQIRRNSIIGAIKEVMEGNIYAPEGGIYTPEGNNSIRVKRLSDGALGRISPNEFDPNLYEIIQ